MVSEARERVHPLRAQRPFKHRFLAIPYHYQKETSKMFRTYYQDFYLAGHVEDISRRIEGQICMIGYIAYSATNVQTMHLESISF